MGVPAKRKASTAVVSYEERMAAMAQNYTKQEESVGVGSFLTFKNGQMAYQGNPIKGNELDTVVVDSILENVYYEGRYDPDNPAPPTCYAFGRDEDEMAPHEKVKEPQASKCSECEHNKFGTAENGKGKACKNTRRLALIPADRLEPEALQEAEMAFAKIPVTSVKGWASYVRTLATLEKKPPLGVVTRIGVVSDDKTQFKVTFQKVAALPNAAVAVALQRNEAAAQEIMFPYAEAAEEAPAPKAKGRATTKRKY